MSANRERSELGQFVAEMKRRRVVRFIIGYAAVAFVLLQLAEIVFPAFGLGEGGLRLLVVLVALGFLPAVVLAWIYDLTKEGIKRTEDRPAARPLPRRLTLVAFTVTTVGVTAGVGWYVIDQGMIGPIELALSGDAYDPGEPIRSLAVLPLEDFSPEGGQEYFAAGMHEELIAHLSKLDDLRVVSRTTVMAYADTTLSAPAIGRLLGVDVLIEGSVNRSGDRVRITLQVIHAPTDTHIETIQFEREAGDVLALQSEVAMAVAREVAGTGRSEVMERTAVNVSPAAQEAYFRGKYEYDRGTPEGYRRALEYFQEAVDADPDFGPAMAGLASARFLVGLEDPDAASEALARARAEAVSALEMDARSTEVQEVLAVIERSMSRLARAAPPPPPGGDADGARAVDSTDSPVARADPEPLDTAWVAAMTSLGRRIEEQVRTRTLRTTGGSDSGRMLDARLLMTSGRFAEAAEELETVVSASPERAAAWEMLARSYVSSGDPDRAATVVQRWHQSGADGAPGAERVEELTRAVREDGDRGYWSWMLDRLLAEEATGGYVPRTELAAAHAGSGNRNEAFELLEAAVDRAERVLLALPADPVWDPLRGDPRFRRVEQQARLMRFAPALRRPLPIDGSIGR